MKHCRAACVRVLEAAQTAAKRRRAMSDTEKPAGSVTPALSTDGVLALVEHYAVSIASNVAKPWYRPQIRVAEMSVRYPRLGELIDDLEGRG